MPRYILHGGGTRQKNGENKKFYNECVAGFGEPVKILIVCYSKPEAEWRKYFENDRKKFGWAVENKKLEFELADIDQQKFIRQIENNNVIFFRGGDNDLLFGRLVTLENPKTLFAGKTIVGSSAGAYWLSKYFYSNDEEALRPGAGILNVKCICHYTDEKKHKLQSLKNYNEDLPVYALRESEFAVIQDY